MFTFRLVFLQHSASSRTSSSTNATVFLTEYKWPTWFEDVCLKKLFLWFFYFVWWVGFLQTTFLQTSIKYSSVYQSKHHPDLWNHRFSPKFNTCPWRLQNSEVCNNCQDCQRWDTVYGKEMSSWLYRQKKKNQSKLQNFQQIYQQSSIDCGVQIFSFHMHGRTDWMKRKMFLITFWQVYVAYLNKTFVWDKLIKKKSNVQYRMRHWNENENFPRLFFIGFKIDLFCF